MRASVRPCVRVRAGGPPPVGGIRTSWTGTSRTLKHGAANAGDVGTL
eukprot:COSAG02_NODE_58509_length_277_cov_0.584270_1_plen_46_part_10